MILANPTNATISDDTGVVTIVENDNNPTLSVNDINIAEGSTGNFIVTMSNPSVSAVTVEYVLVDGTAASGIDYTYTGGTLTILAGETTGAIQVSTIQDLIYETNENFSVILSNPVNATVSDGTGNAAIIENDTQPAIYIIG